MGDFFIPVMGIGVFFYSFLYPSLLSRRLDHWQQVVGKLTEFNDGGLKEGSKTFLREPKVMFEYKVNGERYQSDRVLVRIPILNMLPSKDLKAFYQNHQLDDEVEVFYNPSYPAQSCLVKNTSVDKDSWILTIGYVVLFLAPYVGGRLDELSRIFSDFL